MINVIKKSFCHHKSIEKRGLICLDKLKNKGFPDCYGRLMTIKMDPDVFINNIENGILVDSSILNTDMDGVNYDKDLPNKKLIIKADTSSIREMAWIKSKSYLVMGDLYNGNDGSLYSLSSRNMLKKKIDEMKEIGFILKGASELEYFLYQKKYSENYAKGLSRMKEFGAHAEDYLIQQGDKFEHIYEKFRTKLRDSGVTIETTKGEASIGQHEINISYNEPVTMSDTVLVLKSCLKSIADSNNTTITFMAKPSKERMGSSSHLHVSLHSLDGKNIFQGNDFKINDELSCSNEMLYFLGGLMKHSLDTFIFFAPIINSYKRFKNFTWAPSNLGNWSVDNRTSPFRIVGSGKSLRIEYRIPGGDINQYLAYTALIAAGADGIRNKILPPPILTGNAYANENLKRPPVDLAEALEIFENSNFMEKSFGKEAHQHLVKFYKNEVDSHEKIVTKWELNRYLDLI